jgi:signal transduction histidine kinase/CheY-like chemotaxis protein
VARIRRRRTQLLVGALAAAAAIVAHLLPLTLSSAGSVSLETVIVAVTGLIAGGVGGAVALLFLTAVTFVRSETLGAAFLSTGIDIAVTAVCVVGVRMVRRVVAGGHERERLRRHVRSAEAQLTEAVAGHEAAFNELTRAHHLVDAAQRSSGHFVAMMSHEIRTPLHGLMATIDMLRDEPLSAEGRHRIGIARVSARTLLNIANDILDLSRIEAGAFPLEHEPFHLASVLREVVDETRARAESLGLELRATTEGSLPRALIGDPARIKQILANLVSNALKFTTTGGVSVHARYDGRFCTIDVVDTGHGVPDNKRDVIFDPFVQVESKVTRRAGGAGLGLPISRRLSEAMGGSLVLLNTGAGGSTFRVTLALAASDEEPLEDQSQRILKNPPGRILVVEDHPANQYVAQSLLESLDCTVRIAGTGAEALELLRSETFDLVFMDCQIPAMDGYETTRRMRAVLNRYIPVVAITANAMMDDKQRCLDAGMDDFLPKPFTKSALSDVLCKWLVPGANAIAGGAIAERVGELPVLAEAVFDELWQSLQWRLSPLRKIYESFLSVAHETLDILEPGSPGEGSLLARRLHTLLGSAGMVGARQVERVAAWLGEAVKADRRAELESGRRVLAEALQRFEDELEGRLDTLTRQVSGRRPGDF